MPDLNQLSSDDVRRLAALVDLELSDQEIDSMLPQLRGIIRSVRRVHELELGSSDPAVNFALPESR